MLIILFSMNSYATLSTPVVLLPSPGTSNAPPDIELSWDQIPFATYYEVQISTDQFFAVIVISDTSNSTSFWANGLSLGTTYYWRVMARQTSPPDSSAWSFVNYLNVINKVNLISPVNGQLNQPAWVNFSWALIQNVASYNIQLDTSQNFNSSLLLDTVISNSYFGVPVHFGLKYYWRVTAFFTNGSTAWSDIRTFTTENNITINSPVNGANGQSPNLSLYWSGITGAPLFNVQIDTTTAFNSPELHDVIDTTGSPYDVNNLFFGTKYYWRVRAINDVDTSSWSIIYSFTITNTTQINQPLDGSTDLITRQTFAWYQLPGLSYMIELDSSASFNSMYDTIIITGATPSYYLQDLYYGTKFYWRVKAYHSRDTSDWSVTYTFTTYNNVTPINPYANTSGISIFEHFSWIIVDANDNFNLQVDTSLSFNSPYLLDSSFLNGATSGQPGQLHLGTNYYWRFRAFNNRDSTDWSVTRAFTTAGYLNLLSPLNNLLVSNTYVTLVWNNVNAILDYDYQLDTSPNFNSLLLQNGTLFNSPGVSVVDLYFGTKYYWRARTRNNLDTVRWSTVSNFTTNDFVTLNAPYDGILNVSTMPNLAWSGFENGGEFICEYDTVNTFNSSLLNAVNSSSNNLMLHDLLYFQKYYWRVKAFNLIDTSSWSTIFSLKTIGNASLISPANNSIDLIPPVQLVCTYSNGSMYEFYCSTDSLFQNNVIMQTSSNINLSISGLSSGTKYYWKARYYNANDTTNWTNVWNFTTVAAPNIPVLSLPANNSFVTPLTNVTLSWTASNNATLYEVQVDTTSGFIMASLFSTASLSQQFGLPALGKTYYWRVRAINTASYSPWSSPWSFSVIAVGVHDLSLSQNNFYPNPAVDFLHFDKELKGNWIITDLTGKIVLAGDNAGKLIDLRVLPSGLYILKPEDTSSIRFLKK